MLEFYVAKLFSYSYLLQVEVSYSLHMRTFGLVFSSLGWTPERGKFQSDDQDGEEETRRHLARACVTMSVLLLLRD